MRTDLYTGWAEILDVEDLIAVVRALSLLQDVGAVSADEARAWRKAIVEKRGLGFPRFGGQFDYAA